MKKLFYSRSYFLLLFVFAAASLFGQGRGEETVTFDFDQCPEITIENLTGI